jgi:predicted neuraminidase
MKIVDRRFLNTPTRSSHASTIEFWDDHPVFAWFGGTREGAEDVAIFVNNLHGTDETITIGARDRMPRWNPILFAYDDRLYLFEKAGVFCDRWQTYIHDITEWAPNEPEKSIRQRAVTLPCGLNGPVKTRPIQETGLSEEGDIICGSAVETFSDWTSYFEHFSIKDGEWEFLSRSKPIAVKEKRSYSANGRYGVSLGIIQPALWYDDRKGVQSFFRSSHGLPNLYYTYSDFRGKVHGPFETNLPNPNSGVDVVYTNDRLFLVSNPSSDLRNPLVIQEIRKKSDTEWEIIDTVTIRESIDEADRGTCISQELSYPYMVEHDGKLHLVYTYGRTKIEYVTISI